MLQDGQDPEPDREICLQSLSSARISMFCRKHSRKALGLLMQNRAATAMLPKLHAVGWLQVRYVMSAGVTSHDRVTS